MYPFWAFETHLGLKLNESKFTSTQIIENIEFIQNILGKS